MSERQQPTPQPRETPQDTGQSSSSLQVLAGLLLTLAVVATVIMLVTTSTGAMKVAVISALWSALIGFFLVGKYHYDADQAREALAHERELLALELEKEQVTHREQERLLEQTYMDSLKEHQDETLAAIRAQLDEVRAQLEALTGQDFTYEPTALKAQAHRIAEIGAPNTTPSAEQADTTPVDGEPTGDVKKQPRNTADVVDVEATDVTRPGGRFDTGAFARVNWSPEAAVRSGSHRDDDPDKVRAADVARAEKERKAEAEKKAAEAKAKAEAEKKAAEAKAKAEAEKKAAEAKAKAEAEKKAAEAKAKAEAEAKAKAEAEKKAAEEVAARKAEEEARQKAAAEKEAAARAEELRRKKAAEEAAVKREQEFEARRLEEAKKREEEERAAREFRQAQERAAQEKKAARDNAQATQSRGGRRRRDEHTEGVSVADLLKNLQTNTKPTRSRHRSED